MTKFIRSSKKFRCACCNHPDWCSFAVGSGWICMRIKSEHPTKNGGYFHPMNEAHRKDWKQYVSPSPKAEAPTPTIDFSNVPLDRDWQRMSLFASSLGISGIGFRYLGAGYSRAYHAWAFPMKDANEKIIGYRLRSESGKKWAIPGSHQGLFIPQELFSPIMVICEGATDTAAAISLGYFAVGRPSCAGGVDLLYDFISRRGVKRVIVVPDNDENEAGIRGSEKLQFSIPCLRWLPPEKDLREWVRKGGTREMMDAAMNDLVWETK